MNMIVSASAFAGATAAEASELLNDDPAFAALEAYVEADRLHGIISDELEAAENKIEEPRPFQLIAWREYSAIGDDGIEAARDLFIVRGDAPAAQIEQEFCAAKKRLDAAKRALQRFDQRHGITELRQRARASLDAYWAARAALANVVPTTPRGLVALLAFIREETIERYDGDSFFFVDLAEHTAHLQAIETAVCTMLCVPEAVRSAA
jgi:hypothetical protein